MADRREKISAKDTAPTAEDRFGRSDYIANVLDAVRIGVVLAEFGSGPDDVIYHRSRTLEEIFGIPADYPQDAGSWTKLMVEPEKMLALFREQYEKRIPEFETVYRIKRVSDGEVRWIYGKGRLEFTDDGTPRRLIGTVQDITAQKEQEENLNTFRIAADNSFDSIFWLDKDAHFTYVNEQACRSLGYTREELLAMDLWRIDTVFSKEAWDRNWKDYASGNLKGKLFETIHRRKDGTTFPAEVVPLHLKLGDEEIHIASVRDITERRRSEQLMKDSEVKVTNIIKAMPSGAAMIVNRKFRKVSARFCEITGYGEDELFNQPTRMLFPDDGTYHDIERNLYTLADTGGLGRTESTFKKKDGSLIQVQISASLLPQSDSSQRSLVATFEDISQRKAAEADREKLQSELIQSQKMESIGRLAGGIAHDFNNLLTAIMGNTELALLKTTPSNPLHSQLTTIMQAAESASDLTRQLLSFSRKQIIDPKVVDLNTLIETMHKILTRVIGENITLRAVPQKGLHPVKVDISQVQQIIMNLAVNARDAMPDGGMLSIETGNVVISGDFGLRHDYPVTGNHVMLAVTDTGTGMDDSVKEHLFEPFFTTKPTGKGTGLGLATVYGAVKQNKGIIDVYSEPGKGTCFKVYFPAAEGTAAAPSEHRDDSLPGGSETILIVEDNPMVLHFSESALRLLGYTVYTAASGEEALSVIGGIEKRVELVMTDVILSGMTGKALADALEEKYPGIRILFNSGYTEDSIVAHGVLDGTLDFIGKPFSAAALARKIREILDRK